MATLSADKPRVYGHTISNNDPPVIASDIIFSGAAAGNNGSGYARPLEAGDPFMGFASARADNSSGSAGDKRAHCRSEGYAWLPVTGIDGVDDVGKPVHASDDDTFTTTRSGNSYIGESILYDATRSLTLVRYIANQPLAAIADGATDAATDAAVDGATDSAADASVSAPTDAVTSHDANASFSDTEIEGMLDALGTKINAVGTAYNAAAAKYNTAATNLNALATKYNAAMGKYNAAAGKYNTAAAKLNAVIDALEQKGIIVPS